MSHKTMIDGVAYEIGGGKTLVSGTAYSIDKGKTLVGGTAYEICFVVDGGKVILEVEKITDNTYASETTYENEEFILLDIYPKTNGTVSVTYGGLTKTITDTSGAEEPNAQQVVFGTFNGVTHDTTPASGELTIEGDYYAFACGSYARSKLGGNRCVCVTAINNFGNIVTIPESGFHTILKGCAKLASFEIPDSVVSVGNNAFLYAEGLKSIVIGKGVVSIGFDAFAAMAYGAVDGTNVYYYNLQTVTMRGVTPPHLSKTTHTDGTTEYRNFGGLTNHALKQIIVPKGCGATYKSAEGWSTYADYIVEES